uniref:Outer membrane channel n=1 Tax=Geobacter metallireducens TaxID=28232 RepID=A0A831UDK2_GEOME
MKTPRLSFEKLTELRLPRLDPAGLSLAAMRRDPKSAAFDWLEAAAEAILGPRAAPAPPKPAAKGPPPKLVTVGPFSLVYNQFQLTLQEQGASRFWHLETGWFGGTPKLTVTQKDGGADIVLANAFYPGTAIPASLTASIRLVNGTWTLRLRLKYGSFDAALPLSPWLARTQPALSPVHLHLECAPLGPASALEAIGGGIAAFTPDWLLGTLTIDGFRFPGFAENVSADAALVGLLPPGAPAFFLPNTLRRTYILFAADQQFPLLPAFAASAPTIRLGSFRFDGLSLETALLPNNQALRFLFAQSAADPTLAGLETGGDLRGSDGEPFRIPLRNPRYGQLFDDSRQRTAAGLVAQVDEAPFWLHSPGVSLLLRQSSQAPFAGIVQAGAAPPAMVCRLSLMKSAPRVEGMLVRPEPAPPRSEVLVTWRPLPGTLQPTFGHVEIDATAGTATIRLPRNTSLAVVRRDDFLHLGYRWTNLRLVTEGTTRRLQPLTTGPSYLAVVFPPQSIGEETFFEADPSYKVSDSDMPASQQADQGPSIPNPPSPPVKALLAKPSRLVFTLPRGDQAFLLNGATILDWQPLTPSLAPTALPGSVRLRRPGLPPIILPGPEPFLMAAAPLWNRPPAPLWNRAAPARQAAAAPARQSILGNLRPIDTISILPGLLLKPAPPSATTTQIELPFRLILSPNRYGTWVHANAPVTRDGRTELWHTRLAVRTGGSSTEEPHQYRTVRAIWSRDHDIPTDFDKPFLMPLDQDDRRQLVDLTADFTIGTPTPVSINKLMLSSLGGWLDSDLRLKPPAGYSVEQWRHRATMGRDHFVRVVYKGFLFPFGHRASLVKISERKVELSPTGDPVAYIRQRMFIIVREPERAFGGSAYTHDGREIHFRRVRITTLVTPNLNPPQESPLGADPGQRPLGGPVGTPPIAAFWPRVGPGDFLFHLKGWDWEGHEVDFVMPLAFVRSDMLDNAAEIKVAVDAYNAPKEKDRRKTTIGGQQVAFADAAGYAGKTTFDTESVSFLALVPADGTREPPCCPKLDQAQVAIAALRQMTGSNDPATIELAPRYLEHGFDPIKNKAGLFARVPAMLPAPSLDYTAGKSSDRSGGVATPSMVIRGLSRELGTVGDTADSFAEGNFNPAQFFAGLDAQLLGGITLASILDTLIPGDFLAQAPKLVTANSADEITTTLHWETTKLKASGPFMKGAASKLSLDSVLKTPKAGGARTFQLTGKLDDFTINLAQVVTVGFKEFSFTSLDGKKPDVHVEITGIEFTGALEFVNELRNYLEPANFADPPFLDVTPQGITAGYSLTIPAVSVGVVSIANIALGARLSLPFTGEPMRLRFNLSERQSPFSVSVAPFGGGGFFALAVGMDGVEVLEASLEFGGCVAIDLGVASGGISLMAGIYLKIEVTSNHSQLTGYVRANGSLEVIGLITVSLEFYLGLDYDFGAGKAWGECRVSVKVEVLLFSASVTVTMRKQFAGSSGDPPFGIMMPQPRWEAYAAAFA